MIDRYILRQFLVNAGVLIFLLFSFIVAVDVSLNLDRYNDAAARLLSDEGSSTGVVARSVTCVYLVFDLWWPRLLTLYNFMLGVVLVGAMGFTCVQMVRHRELVALLASGQPLQRAARPILIAAAVLSLVAVANQEVVLPRVAPRLIRDQGDAGRHELDRSPVTLVSDSGGRVFHARTFDALAGTMEGVSIWERDEAGAGRQRITADRAVWDGDAWALENPMIVVDASNPVGSPAPGPSRLATDLDPTALLMRRSARFSQNLSSARLVSMLRNPAGLEEDRRDEVTRLLLGRVASLGTNILALVIALPMFLRREPGNMVVQSIKSAPVALGALAGGVVGASLSLPGLPPAVTVFLPALVLAPAAVASFTSFRT